MIPIPPPGYGAVEKHVWHLSRALQARGHDVEVLNEVVGPRGTDEFRFALRARRRLAGRDFEVIHLHTTGVAFTFHVLGPRDYIYTSHSRHWTLRRGLREHLGFAMEKRAVRGARRVVALSDRMARLMAPLARADVVPNGVDTEQYRPDYASRTGNRIVAVGKVEPHKCFHLAARALEGLDATLTIMGPVPKGAYAEGMRRYPWVNLVGEVPEEALISHLATADIYVHPSSSEAFSLAVVEALASGLPIVGTEVCAGQVEDGHNGFLIRGANQEELVEAMRERLSLLLSDRPLRAAQASRSRELAEKRYRWEFVAATLEQVYARYLEGQSPSGGRSFG